MAEGYDNWEDLNDNAKKQRIINNVDGAGNDWIRYWDQQLQNLDVDGITVFNEPRENIDFSRYRNFCINAIDTWSYVKPNITYVVHGVPFWNLHDWVDIYDAPIEKPGVVYAAHIYYCWEQGYPEMNWSRAYWNNDTNAKDLLRNYLFNEVGIQAMLNRGLPVFMEEIGAWGGAPNRLRFLQDCYDLCKENNIGFIADGLCPFPRYPYGILTSDWSTWNDMGQIWVNNVLGVEPPEPPEPPSPFVVKFAGTVTIQLINSLNIER